MKVHTKYLSEAQVQTLRDITNKIKARNSMGNLALNLIKKHKKNQQKFYRENSFFKKSVELSNLDIEDLVNKKILTYLSKKESLLTLTIKWFLMYDYNIIDPDNRVSEMLDNLNKELFDKVIELSKESLDSKEKVLILTLIAFSAICPDYALKVDDKNKEYFRESIDYIAKFVRYLGKEFDDDKLNGLWSKNVVGEGPILAELRRDFGANLLQQKTEGVYKTDKNRHYIDILNNGNLDEEKLVYLLNLIFDARPIKFEEKEEIMKSFDLLQKYELKIFKSAPPFDAVMIRNKIRWVIQMRI